MKAYRTTLLSVTVFCLAFAGPVCAQAPSFKKRDSVDKAFLAQVGEATVKAVRTSPAKLEMDDHKVTDPKPNRKVIEIKMIWYGAVTGKKFTSTIKITVDPTEKEKWEVIDIDYKDDNPSLKIGFEGKIKKLKESFNR